jgi:hypothetical protein
MSLATPTPIGTRLPKLIEKSCSLCDKQIHKSVDCYSRPNNAHMKSGCKAFHKALFVTPSPPATSTITINYCQKIGHAEKQCYNKKNAEGKLCDYIMVLLVVTDLGLLTKGPKHDFINKTFIADSGETCHVYVLLATFCN